MCNFMKFKDGYMISSGQPVKEYIDSAVRHVLLRQVKTKDQLELLLLVLCPFSSPNVIFVVSGSTWHQGEDHA